MKIQIHHRDDGHILVCALCTIVIVSLIGANVLVNCITHYNVTAKQLKGWKEALYAAEAGGDAGFDEVRKALNPLSLPFTTDGWAAAPSPAPTPGPAWTKTISGFGQEGNLSTTVTIDKLTDTTGTIPNSTPYYRIRAIGTAKLLGLPRVGLSDQFFAGGPNFVANSASHGVGETLLPKIDCKYDHSTASFGEGGPIWGDVATNGGNVTHSGYQISGIIDNNVPFTVPPLSAPDTTGFTAANSGTATDTANGTSDSSPTGFVYSGITGSKTIKNGNTSNTSFPYAYAKIVVNGDITGKITVEKGVTAEIWFTGNMKVKAGDLDNQNVDRGTKTANPGSLGVPPLIPPTPADDPNPSRVGHMKFFGISPTTSGTTQTIELDPPGNIFATFYAPSADITLAGNTDIFSAIVGRSFSGNGNTGFHYDKALNQVDIGVMTDYQIASYVEDVR